ncbi:MAG: hypothetical protein GY711_21285 [bacterium]|nr:hypothetical protein [bacterium]
MTRLACLACLLLLAAPLHADVLVVDDDGGPGVDFTDIPPAILAARKGDALDVRAGTYSSFTVRASLRIIGSPGASVPGGATVSDTTKRTVVVLADLELSQVRVESCRGTVLLDGLAFDGPHVGARIAIDRCDDVRIHGCTGDGAVDRYGVRIDDSRAEIVGSALNAGRAAVSQCAAPNDGPPGVYVENARVQVALSSVEGGRGGDNYASCGSICGIPGAGNGGPGVRTYGQTTELFLAGTNADLAKGGFAGIAELCSCDGDPGPGIDHQQGTLRYSNVRIEAGGAYCTDSPPITGQGAQTVAFPADLTLERLSTATPGAMVGLRVHGAPGLNVRVYIGKSPLRVPANNPAVIERLTSEEWVKPVELIPAAGHIDVFLRIPVDADKGYAIFCQATAVDIATQSFQRSNSVPIVVR